MIEYIVPKPCFYQEDVFKLLRRAREEVKESGDLYAESLLDRMTAGLQRQQRPEVVFLDDYCNAVIEILDLRDQLAAIGKKPGDDMKDIVELLQRKDDPYLRETAEWVLDSDKITVCSYCECQAPQQLFVSIPTFHADIRTEKTRYCPNCGRKMEKVSGK